MTKNATTDLLTAVIERDIAYPPEKIWRALTEPKLIAEWLMKNDFALSTGHHFTLSGDWGSVDCKVLAIEPNKTLSYTWATMGLESIVTFTLSPTSAGTHLRVEQSGFPADMQKAYKGAQYGWQGFLAKLDQVVAGIN